MLLVCRCSRNFEDRPCKSPKTPKPESHYVVSAHSTFKERLRPQSSEAAGMFHQLQENHNNHRAREGQDVDIGGNLIQDLETVRTTNRIIGWPRHIQLFSGEGPFLGSNISNPSKHASGSQGPGRLNQPCMPHDGEEDPVENQDTLGAHCRRAQQLEMSSQPWTSKHPSQGLTMTSRP